MTYRGTYDEGDLVIFNHNAVVREGNEWIRLRGKFGIIIEPTEKHKGYKSPNWKVYVQELLKYYVMHRGAFQKWKHKGRRLTKTEETTMNSTETLGELDT